MDLTFNSPDSRFVTRLVQPRVFEAPVTSPDARAASYYKTIWLADQRFSGRHLTGKGLWSTNSRHFAAEEWLVPDQPPADFVPQGTRLVIFDVVNCLAAVAATAGQGHIVPVDFEDGVLLCREGAGDDGAPLMEVHLGSITSWTAMGHLSDVAMG